jgi:SAM-dependent methyltransferase
MITLLPDLLKKARSPALLRLHRDLAADLPQRPTYLSYPAALTALGTHIENHLPHLTNGGLRVLDVGPGIGAFLVLARALGNTVRGVDAPAKTPRVHAYARLTRYWKLDVAYDGLETYLPDPTTWGVATLDVVHVRGAFDAALQAYARRAPDGVARFVQLVRTALAPSGVLWIGHNASPQRAALCEALRAQTHGFTVLLDTEPVTHWRRTPP